MLIFSHSTHFWLECFFRSRNIPIIIELVEPLNKLMRHFIEVIFLNVFFSFQIIFFWLYKFALEPISSNLFVDNDLFVQFFWNYNSQ